MTKQTLGFVYRWVHTPSQEYYIGIHRGPTSDGYVGSGARFRKRWFATNACDWKREILFEGAYVECIKHEARYVTREVLQDRLCLNKARGGLTKFPRQSGYTSAHQSYRTKPQQVTVCGVMYLTRIHAVTRLRISFEDLDRILISQGWASSCSYNQYNRR